jgi:E3 ubiquitin-protein ligase SIAH1
VLDAFGCYFCLHFEAFQLGRAPVYMAYLRFMGDETDAAHFTYTLEVGHGDRKMTWQGVPTSIRSSPRAVRDAHDGLVLQRKVALMFSGGEGSDLNLRVTGRIAKATGNR